MQRGGAAAVTYDQEFIAVRHESDLLTPLFHAPLVSLSVRELGYVGAFVICAMLSFTGSAPPSLAAAGLVLAAAAFFRWRGEMPEMYLYYAALALLSAPAGKRGQRGRRARGDAGRRGRLGRPARGPLAAILGRPAGDEEGAAHAVAGPGAEHVLGSGSGTGGAAGHRRGGGGGGGDVGRPSSGSRSRQEARPSTCRSTSARPAAMPASSSSSTAPSWSATRPTARACSP